MKEIEKAFTKIASNHIDDEFDWLTSEEAANYLRVSVKTLLNNVSNGTIPYYKFGRRNRYKKSELREMLEQNKRGGHFGYNQTK